MLKKEIYPKTERIKLTGIDVRITEKLDGSNLCFFKLDDELYIAMRNNIVTLTEVFNSFDNIKYLLYADLKSWLEKNGTILKDSLNNNSAICGEWIGMGIIKYDDFDKKFYMFAKANVYESLKLENIKYDHDLFIYPFIDQMVPAFIGFVPLVKKINFFPNVEYLDELYEQYIIEVEHKVEGFVINFENRISKYVRMKNGRIQDHFDRE